jgi:hypothetical protein
MDLMARKESSEISCWCKGKIIVLSEVLKKERLKVDEFVKSQNSRVLSC